MHTPGRSFQEKVWYVLVATVAVTAAAAVFVIANTYVLLTFAGVIFAILAAAFTTRIMTWLHVPYSVAFMIAWVVILGVPLGLLAVSFPSLQTQIGSVGATVEGFDRQLGQLLSTVPGGSLLLEQVGTLDVRSVLRDLSAGQLSGAALTGLNIVAGTVYLLFIALFGSFDPARYRTWALTLTPQTARDQVADRMRTASRALSWWVIGRISSMFIVTVLTYVGLLILGVNLAFLLAVLAGLLSFVPNFGSIAAAVIATIVALAQSPTLAFATIVLFLIVQTVESYGITPFIQQWAVHIPPAFLLALQIIFGILFGVLGVILAGPLAAIIVSLLRSRYERTYKAYPTAYSV